MRSIRALYSQKQRRVRRASRRSTNAGSSRLHGEPTAPRFETGYSLHVGSEVEQSARLAEALLQRVVVRAPNPTEHFRSKGRRSLGLSKATAQTCQPEKVLSLESRETWATVASDHVSKSRN